MWQPTAPKGGKLSIGRVNPELYALSADTWNRLSDNSTSFKYDSNLDVWMQNYANVLCINCWQQLLISSRNLEFFTNGYHYLIQIISAAVVAPMYLSGKIEFGVFHRWLSLPHSDSSSALLSTGRTGLFHWGTHQ